MTKYLNELAPWESTNEYYSGIELGKKLSSQIDAIDKSTTKMVQTQLESAHSAIVSHDRIVEGLDAVACGVDRVADGIYGLRAAFEWGISKVVWQIEQNRKVLRSVLEVLSAPLDTQARELRARAEDAYANGWIDDAVEDFLESEKKNRYDFSIHISLGMIFLFDKIDKTKALHYFEKAIKYARPKSPYHASYALLYKGLIMRDVGQIEEAEKNTTEAIKLTPDFAEALYQNAQYNAQLGRTRESLLKLKAAIQIEKDYCLKADGDPMFDPIREDVVGLFERLRDEESHKTISLMDHITKKISKLQPVISALSNEAFVDVEKQNGRLGQMDELLSLLGVTLQRNSYFDFIDINDSLTELEQECDELITDLKQTLNRIADENRSSIPDAKSQCSENQFEHILNSLIILLLGSFIVPALTTLIVAPGYNKLFALVFCIPLVSQMFSIMFIYYSLTQPQNGQPHELIVAWSTLIFTVIWVLYFIVRSIFFSQVKDNTIADFDEVSRKASSYAKAVAAIAKI